MKLGFTINRLAKSCHTPRRNSDVAAALSWMGECTSWSSRVHSYFVELLSKQQNNAFDMSSINIKTVFNPVLPLFEERDAVPAIEESRSDALVPVNSVGNSKALLSIGEVNSYLEEQKRSLTVKRRLCGAIVGSTHGCVCRPNAPIWPPFSRATKSW